jgi:hypothetical protein
MNIEDGRNKRNIIEKLKESIYMIENNHPSQFHNYKDEVIYLICRYLANPQDIYHFLSTNKFLNGFMNDQNIWKASFEVWFWCRSEVETKINRNRLEAWQIQNPLSDNICTYKGLIYQTHELLKSFCWKEAPQGKEYSKSGFYTNSHDFSSGVYNYEKIMIPSNEADLQTKLIYVPNIGYYLIAMTSKRVEIYEVRNKTKNLEKVFSSESEHQNIVQWRRSFTRDQSVIMLKGSVIHLINLNELRNMSDNEESEIIVEFSLENNLQPTNFEIIDKAHLLLTTNESIEILDIIQNKIVSKVDIDLSIVSLRILTF